MADKIINRINSHVSLIKSILPSLDIKSEKVNELKSLLIGESKTFNNSEEIFPMIVDFQDDIRECRQALSTSITLFLDAIDQIRYQNQIVTTITNKSSNLNYNEVVDIPKDKYKEKESLRELPTLRTDNSKKENQNSDIIKDSSLNKNELTIKEKMLNNKKLLTDYKNEISEIDNLLNQTSHYKDLKSTNKDLSVNKNISDTNNDIYNGNKDDNLNCKTISKSIKDDDRFEPFSIISDNDKSDLEVIEFLDKKEIEKVNIRNENNNKIISGELEGIEKNNQLFNNLVSNSNKSRYNSEFNNKEKQTFNEVFSNKNKVLQQSNLHNQIQNLNNNVQSNLNVFNHSNNNHLNQIYNKDENKEGSNILNFAPGLNFDYGRISEIEKQIMERPIITINSNTTINTYNSEQYFREKFSKNKLIKNDAINNDNKEKSSKEIAKKHSDKEKEDLHLRRMYYDVSPILNKDSLNLNSIDEKEKLNNSSTYNNINMNDLLQEDEILNDIHNDSQLKGLRAMKESKKGKTINEQDLKSNKDDVKSNNVIPKSPNYNKFGVKIQSKKEIKDKYKSNNITPNINLSANISKVDKGKISSNNLINNSNINKNNIINESVKKQNEQEITSSIKNNNKQAVLKDSVQKKKKIEKISELIIKIYSSTDFQEILGEIYGNDLHNKLTNGNVDDEFIEEISNTLVEIEKLREKDSEIEKQIEDHFASTSKNNQDNVNKSFNSNLLVPKEKQIIEETEEFDEDEITDRDKQAKMDLISSNPKSNKSNVHLSKSNNMTKSNTSLNTIKTNKSKDMKPEAINRKNMNSPSIRSEKPISKPKQSNYISKNINNGNLLKIDKIFKGIDNPLSNSNNYFNSKDFEKGLRIYKKSNSKGKSIQSKSYNRQEKYIENTDYLDKYYSNKDLDSNCLSVEDLNTQHIYETNKDDFALNEHLKRHKYNQNNPSKITDTGISSNLIYSYSNYDEENNKNDYNNIQQDKVMKNDNDFNSMSLDNMNLLYDTTNFKVNNNKFKGKGLKDAKDLIKGNKNSFAKATTKKKPFSFLDKDNVYEDISEIYNLKESVNNSKNNLNNINNLNNSGNFTSNNKNLLPIKKSDKQPIYNLNTNKKNVHI